MNSIKTQFLSARQVAERTSISVSSIRRLASERRFPQPVRITDSRIAWLSEDIDQWIAERYLKGRAANDNNA